MVLTFSVILLGLLALLRPLQKNGFYIFHASIIILSAYYLEHYHFRVTPFAPKTFLLFLVFHIISINIVAFVAYYVDKSRAKKGGWRISELQLHTLELLGGWTGAYLGQKVFNHKTRKKDYQAYFWFILFFQIGIVWFILKFLKIV